MIINILIGFLIPWIFGIKLYKKSREIVLFISPIGIALSHIINSLAHEYKLWHILPKQYISIDILFFELGMYAILPSYMIYYIHRHNRNPLLLIFIFTLATTLSEYFWVLIGRVIYDNGWNEYLTFISYLIPYTIIYVYYLYLVRTGILQATQKDRMNH